MKKLLFLLAVALLAACDHTDPILDPAPEPSDTTTTAPDSIHYEMSGGASVTIEDFENYSTSAITAD